jgi:D-alanyl-D-alanine carboxypeptidase
MAAMLPSANDAANGIAEQISGSIPEFVKLMNERAIQAGALHTNFANANGLPNDEHVTTAYDMAMITKEALKNEQFRRIFGTLQYEIPPTNMKSEPRDFWTEHKMLKPGKYKYDGVIGGKTGYTKEAQCTLVTAAQRGDRELIVVVLKSSTSGVYNDTKTLLDYGFDEFNPTTIMLPAITTANLMSPQDNLKSAQDIINKVKDIPYTWLLNKNVDASDIAIDYSAVNSPGAQNPELNVDIHLKNQSDLMYSNLGLIMMESLPNSNNTTNTLLSKIMYITWIILKITAAVILLPIILLITLRWFIRRKNKKRRRYRVLDTSIKREKSVNYNRSRG